MSLFLKRMPLVYIKSIIYEVIMKFPGRRNTKHYFPVEDKQRSSFLFIHHTVD